MLGLWLDHIQCKCMRAFKWIRLMTIGKSADYWEKQCVEHIYIYITDCDREKIGYVLFITTVAIYNQSFDSCVGYKQEILWCTLHHHHPLNSYATEVNPSAVHMITSGIRPILAKNQFFPP